MDTRATRVALRRQEAALDVLETDRAVRPRLLDLVLEPRTARPVAPTEDLDWAQRDLDEPKRRAVRAALGSPDVVIVEGPPGTGKTTFITELVLQHLAREPLDRILISSQTNAALDNALERLHRVAPHLRLVRVAGRRSERVADAVEQFRIERRLEEWREEVIQTGEEWLASWAREHGIDERRVEAGMRLDELANALDRRTVLVGHRREAEAEVKNEHEVAERRGTPTADLRARLDDLDDQLASLRADVGILRARLESLKPGSLSDIDRLDASGLRERARAEIGSETAGALDCRRLIELLSDWHLRFGRSPEFFGAVMLRAQVVAATCIGYAGTPGADAVEFDLGILDEASKATATEALVPLTRCRRLVLVGDHRQLPPFIDEALHRPELLRDHEISRTELAETLFDRFRHDLPEVNRVALSLQHRMVPAIGDLISKCFYDGQLHSVERASAAWLPLVQEAPVLWLSTSRFQSRAERRAGGTILNPAEAGVVRQHLDKLDYVARMKRVHLSVIVLSGYAGQASVLAREVADGMSQWRNISATASTVDAFQGREADVAIYSVTRSNPRETIGFLREARRLNVALSRGREALVIVGDHDFAVSVPGENPLRTVLDHIEEHPGECALLPAEEQ